jgi:hypothetical protein
MDKGPKLLLGFPLHKFLLSERSEGPSTDSSKPFYLFGKLSSYIVGRTSVSLFPLSFLLCFFSHFQNDETRAATRDKMDVISTNLNSKEEKKADKESESKLPSKLHKFCSSRSFSLKFRLFVLTHLFYSVCVCSFLSMTGSLMKLS